ncbi:MAG: alpha/beta hydrolase [Bacteroides sp.]|nr:alpha/beta hydrolase [Bacteroides sp.]
MKKTIVWLVCLLWLGNVGMYAQNEYFFDKTTYPYSVKGEQTLYLDKYSSPLSVATDRTPCIIFMFGGAFARGSRDMDKYIPYFDYMVRQGYTVISIDYRLGLKGVEQDKELNEEGFVRRFIYSVDMAVEDLFDATRYVLDRAEEWNIDPNAITINGSSAGAVTVLQAEHAICNGTHNVSAKLPAGFNYVGVVAFAGAIFVPDGPLTWAKAPCPIMMFHGDADLQVPYDKLTYGNMGFYGAKSISDGLAALNYPYYFYKFDDYGHQIASDPIRENREDVLWFLNTLVKEKKPYMIFREQKEIGRPVVPNKNFGIPDYVKGNFGM